MKKPIVFLTTQQRAALVAGTQLEGWAWDHPRRARMGHDLADSGLLRWLDWSRGTVARTTVPGRMALRAKPSGRAWIPSPPTLATSHVIRRCFACAVCGKLCEDPPKTGADRGHMTCFVLRDGWCVLSAAPPAEINKMRLEDLTHLGITLADIDAMRDDARAAREAK
jgi:hypothetical protein